MLNLTHPETLTSAKPPTITTYTELEGTTDKIPSVLDFPIPWDNDGKYNWRPDGNPHIAWEHTPKMFGIVKTCGWRLHWDRTLEIDPFLQKPFEAYVKYSDYDNFIQHFDTKGSTPLLIGTFLMMNELLERVKKLEKPAKPKRKKKK